MRLLLLLSIGCILLSCGQQQRDQPSLTEPAAVLLEDFEQDTLWSLDSASDYAALTSTRRSATSGTWALQADYCDNGREKAILRKEVDLDLSGVRSLLIDVDNAGTAAPAIGMALRGRDGSLYETTSIQLKPGMNRDLAFTLDGTGFKSGTDVAKWRSASQQINRMMVYVLPDKTDGRAIIDNLRYVGEALLRKDRARFVEVTPASASSRRYGTVEIRAAVAFPADALMTKDARADTFMRRMSAVQARVRAPDGTETIHGGFCTAIDSAEGEAIHRYGVRISPHLAGEWRYQLGVTASGVQTWSEPASFICAPEAAGPGPIRIDAGDPRWFSRADGTWYYPIGENVAWSGDYAPYLEPIAAAGGTLIRTWMCPWNNGLDVGGRLEVVNFAAAEAIDRLFAQAAEHGVAVQLCLQYHGMLGGDWAKNPFNKANGGPCTDAREMWTHGQARALFKRYLDYVVARWGHSPQLFAWELWNEADLTPRFADADVVSWHREMADHLKLIDPHRHLVTTSTTNVALFPGLWRLDAIDIAQLHVYDPKAGSSLSWLRTATADIRRPVMIAEVGRGWDAPDDQHDRQGTYLRHALWVTWMSGFAGSALPWWWDTHIEPNGLHRQLKPLAAFVAGEDPRGHELRPTSVPMAGGYEAHCLIGTDLAYGFIADAAALQRPGAAVATRSIAGTVTVSGLAPGPWSLEIWDVAQGTVVDRAAVRAAEDGTIAITLPERIHESAFKLKRAPRSKAGVRYDAAK
ncbi:MAG: hypothetical protein H0V44_12110 [Planctomycetes bacterium]|nr:hypothetical protein [Planctomycetota bacterium]